MNAQQKKKFMRDHPRNSLGTFDTALPPLRTRDTN